MASQQHMHQRPKLHATAEPWQPVAPDPTIQYDTSNNGHVPARPTAQAAQAREQIGQLADMARLTPEAVQRHEKEYLAYEHQQAGRFQTPDNFDAGVQRIVGALRRVFAARTMLEHYEAFAATLWVQDLAWDAPPIMMRDREHARTATYTFKALAHVDITPELVQVKPVPRGHIVEVTGIVHTSPRRTWLLPLTMLLPKSVDGHFTIKLGVQGSLANGKIELLYGRMHNLPSLPTLVRLLNGFLQGQLTHLTEPLWAPFMELLGDDYYSGVRGTHAKGIREQRDGVISSARDISQQALDKAVETANSAKMVAGAAYARAAEAVHSTMGTTKTSN